MCYAEFASTVPVSGSAYTFSYASLGEIFAWIIGWDLILEMFLGASRRRAGLERRTSASSSPCSASRCRRRSATAASFDLPAVVLVLVLGLLVDRAASRSRCA